MRSLVRSNYSGIDLRPYHSSTECAFEGCAHGYYVSFTNSYSTGSCILSQIANFHCLFGGIFSSQHEAMRSLVRSTYSGID